MFPCQATESEAPLSSSLEDHLGFAVGSAGRGLMRTEQRKSSAVRSVAWSPAGVDAAGGCLLTVVSEDYKVAFATCQKIGRSDAAARSCLSRGGTPCCLSN